MSSIAGRLEFDAPDIVFGSSVDSGIVSRPALRRMWSDHQAGRHDYAFQLWSLVMLEFWFRRCIDSEAAGEPNTRC